MIKISFSPSKVPTDVMLGLNYFEEQFEKTIKRLLADSDYSHLLVAPFIELVIRKRGDSAFNLRSNASGTIKKSEEVQRLLFSWLKDYEELNVYLSSKYELDIFLNFKERRQMEKGEVDKGKSELPVFIPTKVRYNFDQIILPENVKNRIMADMRVISSKEQVYRVWGFEEIDSIPRLVICFYGEPGTGKTMLAHAIACHFSKPLLALNYSEIESKYVGDAAKKLKHAFDTATEMDAVLFFDEADSFLGKRIENVSQGADQAINSLRSQMLILLEEHSGIVVFATNLVANFDKAFKSRFLDCVQIPMPNREARAEIIKKMIPSKLPLKSPLTEDDFLKASDIIGGIAGREIKNAILHMLIEKADRPDYRFSSEDICDAMKAKMRELEDLKNEGKEHVNEEKGTPIQATEAQLNGIKSIIKQEMENPGGVKTVKL